MVINRSNTAAKQNRVVQNSLSSIASIPKPDSTNEKALGTYRFYAALDLLYTLQVTLQHILSLAVGKCDYNSHHSKLKNDLVNAGLAEEIPFPSKHFKRLIVLTPKGHALAEELREQRLMQAEESGKHDLYLPCIPRQRTERIALPTIEHDLVSQCLALSVKGVSAIAMEKRFRRLLSRKPDAVTEAKMFKGTRTFALEYDKSGLSTRRRQDRLLGCDQLLRPNLMPEEEQPDLDSLGAGGITNWIIVCRYEGHAQKYREILSKGSVPTNPFFPNGNRHQLAAGRFWVFHSEEYRWGPFKRIVRLLEDGMARE